MPRFGKYLELPATITSYLLRTKTLRVRKRRGQTVISRAGEPATHWKAARSILPEKRSTQTKTNNSNRNTLENVPPQTVLPSKVSGLPAQRPHR